MTRSIILLIAFLLTSQAQAFSSADIIGEWEWLGDSVGRYANPDSAIKTNETHIILFKDKTAPKVRYLKEGNQICNDCDGNYALISTKGAKPIFEYSGVWMLNSDLMVIKRRAISHNSRLLIAGAQRVTYYKEKKILALGTLVNNVNKGKFSYYRKRPDSDVSISPYYSDVKDEFVNDIDISRIKLGMTPKSVIHHIKKEFMISDIVQFDKYNNLIPYVEKITAVRQNNTKIDNYTFNFAKPPYANRLLSIHRNQRFVFKDNMEDKPPTMAHVKAILLHKYGKAKVITKENNDVRRKQKGIVISWFNKPKSCNTQFKPHTKKPECPLLFDAQLSSFSMNHRKYPGIATLLELHLINYPAIVQNGKAMYQQEKIREEPKRNIKPLHNKKSLEFEL